MPYLLAAPLLVIAAAEVLPLDPGLANDIVQLGAAGILVLGFGLVLTRQLRTKGEAVDLQAQADARLSEMRADRDAWRKVAETSLSKMDRLTDVVESLVGRKIPE